MQDMIAAKFDPPVWMGEQISRDLLLERLNGAFTHRLTLVHAPAGYGKTSLLAQWRDSLDPAAAQVAWLTLEHDDRDPKRFVNYLLLAMLQEALDAGDTRPVAGIIDAARLTRPSPIVTVSLAFDRPAIDTPVVGFPGQWAQWAFDTSHLAAPGEAAGRRVALVVSGADEALRMEEADVVRKAHAVLTRAGGQAREARLLGSRVLREPRATFSLAPGQPARPPTRTAAGGLYLASDWVDTGLPATIEGAIEAGRLAAEAVLRDG